MYRTSSVRYRLSLICIISPNLDYVLRPHLICRTYIEEFQTAHDAQKVHDEASKQVRVGRDAKEGIAQQASVTFWVILMRRRLTCRPQEHSQSQQSDTTMVLAIILHPDREQRDSQAELGVRPEQIPLQLP